MELIINNLGKKYFGYDYCLRALNLKVNGSGVYCVYGEEGCGKTTLFKIIAGLEDYEEGEIFWNGKPLNKIPLKDRNFSVMFDNCLNINKSVYENSDYVLRIRGINELKRREKILKTAEDLNITNLLHCKVKNLSLTDRLKADFLRLAVRNADIYLIDDPLSKINEEEKEQAENFLIDSIKLLSGIKILATKDRKFSFKISDKIAVLSNMELSDFKNFNDIYENPQTITDCNLASSEINLLKFKVDGDELTAFNRKISVPKIISEVYNGKDILLGFYSSSLVEGDGGMKVEILDTIICDDGIKCISETNGQQFFFNLKSTLKEGDKSVKLLLSDKYFLFDLNGKRIL